ncbi:hypothetical protein BDV18DRAFT_148167 [Aspergillus unguis]
MFMLAYVPATVCYHVCEALRADNECCLPMASLPVMNALDLINRKQDHRWISILETRNSSPSSNISKCSQISGLTRLFHILMD